MPLTAQEWANWVVTGNDCILDSQVPFLLKEVHARVVHAVYHAVLHDRETKEQPMEGKIRFYVIASGGSSIYQSVWNESKDFETEAEAQAFADEVRLERACSDGGDICIIKGECLREECWH